MAGVARVLVDSPLPQLDRLLDYRIPDALDGVADAADETTTIADAVAG